MLIKDQHINNMKIRVYSEHKYRYKEFKLSEKSDYFILII